MKMMTATITISKKKEVLIHVNSCKIASFFQQKPVKIVTWEEVTAKVCFYLIFIQLHMYTHILTFSSYNVKE